MGDLTKNFSHYEVQCICGCGVSWVNPRLIEKLQHVRDVLGKPITITSGVRCESFNSSIKGSLVSSHMPDADGMGLAVDIACTSSKTRYELVDVAIKFFRRIGIAGEHSGNFIHLDVDPNKMQDVIWTY
jgi:Peptidase M15.